MAIEKSLDAHGQPLKKGFNAKRNAIKAFENLLGIVAGVQGDVSLTDGEVLFLQSWLIEQEYLVNDPDVVDFMDAINSVLADGVITQEEKDDLSCMLSDFLEYRDDFDYLNNDLQQSIKRATGVFAGLSADNALSDAEVYFLRGFLKTHKEARAHWPLSAVHRAVEDALADGYLSGAEKEYILLMLHDAVGGSLVEDGAATGKSTRLPLDQVECVDFDGKVFCFTGAMTSGTRKECSQRVLDLGASVSRGVTLKVDYLVIGPIASRDWFNTSYGRKIELAVQHRDERDTGVRIISEEEWLRWL